MASTVSFVNLERRNITEPNVSKVAKDQGIPTATQSQMENKDELAKLIACAIHNLEETMNTTIDKSREAKETHKAERAIIDEARERTQHHNTIFKTRERLFFRLPRNQSVIPVHNALLKEHAKERMLIREAFTVAKAGKIDLREKKKAESTETEAMLSRHRKQIELLHRIAEYSGSDVVSTTTEEQVEGRFDDVSKDNENPHRKATPKRTVSSSATKDAIHKSKMSETTVPTNGKLEEICDAGHTHGCLQVEDVALYTADPTCINVINEDQDDLKIWMHCHVKLCNDSIAELEEQHKEEAEMAEDDHEREVSALEGVVLERGCQLRRFTDILVALHDLDTGKPQWSRISDMVITETASIREEARSINAKIHKCKQEFEERQQKAVASVNERRQLYTVVIEDINDYAEACGMHLKAD
ncbi:hypothetical protein Ptr902_11245 [Pyrenophora tritici-repentis]|nr:hypothetical protein Ptr902_11245 [Pyrenophora tritici-repentis]